MEIDYKKLQKLVKWARKQGISHLKCGEIELHLGPLAPKSPTRPKHSAKPIESVVDDAPITEEDLLFWSSTTTPESKGPADA